MNGKRWEVTWGSILNNETAILDQITEHPNDYWEVTRNGRVVAILVHPDHPDLP